MSAEEVYEPIPVLLSRPDLPPVVLTVRQMDGLHRVGFSCEAAEMALQIERGQASAAAFGMPLLKTLPVSKEADARAARFVIEMALALHWAWVSLSGAEHADAGRWTPELPSLMRLLNYGDASLGVGPLVGSLSAWFNGPLVEMVAEGKAKDSR